MGHALVAFAAVVPVIVLSSCTDSPDKSPISPACSFGVTVGASVFSGAGGTATASVTAPAGCRWTALSSTDWLRITAGATGSGDGTVMLAVAAHDGAAERTAALTIAQQTFTITQRVCSVRVRQPELTLGSGATTSEIALEAEEGCRWAASADAPWITINPSSGAGSGALTVHVADNPSDHRQGVVLLNGSRAIGVTQSGSPCTFEVSVTPSDFAVAGGSGTLRVHTRDACDWRIETSAGWLHVGAPLEGRGGGEIPFTVTGNTGPQDRRGDIRVGDAAAEITQRGTASCEYRVDRVQIVVPVDGDNGSVSLATAPGCTWTATSPGSFVRLRGETSYSGSGTLSYTVEAHPRGAYVTDFRRAPLEIRWEAPTLGQNVWLLQVPDCNVFFSLPTPQTGSTNELSFSAAGGRQVVFTHTDSPFTCPWRVDGGGADWLQSAAAGRVDPGDPAGFVRGDGELIVTVQPNATSLPRTAVLFVGGRGSLTVRQTGR